MNKKVKQKEEKKENEKRNRVNNHNTIDLKQNLTKKLIYEQINNN